MRLQVAIDRVELNLAADLARKLDGVVDMIELGTSLVKDYGNHSIETLRQSINLSQLIVDSKTIDEGAYEFNQAFKYGADLVTVMGAASIETLRACYEVAEKYKKTMVIDLLECSDEKIEKMVGFDNAIYCLHHSVDKKRTIQPVETVATFHHSFPMIKRIAIAGGIQLASIAGLKAQGLTEIVIVGSAITKADDVVQAAKRFMEA